MQQPEPPDLKPSIFAGALIGSLAGLIVGALIPFIVAIRAGDYYDPAAFKLMACLSGFGAWLGFEVAVWRCKEDGSGARADEWQEFLRSPGFWLLLLIVL